MVNSQAASCRRVPHFNVELKPNSFSDGCLKVIKDVRPEWSSVNINFQVFSDGITNNLIRAYVGMKPEDSLLIRIYGMNTDKIINRETELKLLKVLEPAKLGPELYATFLNGIVYQYFPGKTLEQQCFYSAHIFPLVAQNMAKLHQQIDNCSSIFSPNHSVIWEKIESFLAHCLESPLPRTMNSQEQYFRYNGAIDYALEFPSKTELLKELGWLRQSAELLGSPLVLCHNDLLLANVLYDETNRTVHIIDFEYAGPNYQAYDIANHFNEYASGVDCFDSSQYPDEDFQTRWLSAYLNSFIAPEKKHEINEQQMISKLLEQIKWFRLVSHLFCGAWGLFQIAHSALVYDFHGYAHCRLQEYFKLKESLLVGA